MLANGNGKKQTCVQNLLLIVRGEVCFDRIRGLDPRIIDRPSARGADEARRDALWTLKTYEPRAVIESVHVMQENAENGNFRVTANIR